MSIPFQVLGRKEPAARMKNVKSWDAIIAGAGIIGLSLAIELRKQGLHVLIVEKGEPGREASWAAGGMLVGSGLETPPPLRSLAAASARMYPEFVHELEDESGLKIDLLSEGTLLLDPSADQQMRDVHPLPASLQELEPNLSVTEKAPLFLSRCRRRCCQTSWHRLLLWGPSVGGRTRTWKDQWSSYQQNKLCR